MNWSSSSTPMLMLLITVTSSILVQTIECSNDLDLNVTKANKTGKGERVTFLSGNDASIFNKLFVSGFLGTFFYRKENYFAPNNEKGLDAFITEIN